MEISRRDWSRYSKKLSAINQKAADTMQAYMDANPDADDDELIWAAVGIADKYGEAAGALACEMYDSTAKASGANVPPAEPADAPDIGETAKAVRGTMKNHDNSVPATVGRMVKQVGADTMLKNAKRDQAQFAWIPNGDTCAFCLTLASRGWQYMRADTLKNGHAEHIHANCDCEFAIRFDSDTNVEGYDPGRYRRIYDEAEGDTPDEKINAIRRAQYAVKTGKDGTLEEALTEEKVVPWTSKKMKAALGDNFGGFADKVNASPNKALYERFGETPTYVPDGKGFYQPSTDSVHFGMEYTHPGMDEYSTVGHESGHMFDHHLGRVDGLSYTEVDAINANCVIGSGRTLTLQPRPSNSDEFLSALRGDMERLRPKVADRTIRGELMSVVNPEVSNASSGVQDALDGFFGTQDKGILAWGHGNRYYNRYYNDKFVAFGNQQALKSTYQSLGFDASSLEKTKQISRSYEAASEAWANISSAVTCGGQELEYIREFMPDALAAYLKIVGGI